jgi:uncharacterized protein YdbL (DUF1318 family)
MILKENLSKISLTLGIIVTVVTLIAGGVRVMDLTTQTAKTVGHLSARIDDEKAERVKQDTILKDAIVKERESRNAEYADIKIRLTEIDTRLLYIQQGIDSLSNQHQSGGNTNATN